MQRQLIKMTVSAKHCNMFQYVLQVGIMLCLFEMLICCSAASVSSGDGINVTELYRIEHELTKDVSQFIDVMKENIMELEDMLDKAKQSRFYREKYGLDNYMSHPVTVYRMIKRFAEGWGKLNHFIKDDDPRHGKYFFTVNLRVVFFILVIRLEIGHVKYILCNSTYQCFSTEN